MLRSAFLRLRVGLLVRCLELWIPPFSAPSPSSSSSPPLLRTPPLPTPAPFGVKERSALVLGWFYATPRELEYVRKLYTRNGYTHVVVLPSVVQRIAKPRGWYRTIRQHTPPAHLGRHFDVVHCLSGGFLSMYVLRSSGVPITYSSLVLDSTPILPKPGSYTRFTRAYMRENGLAFPLKLLPTRAHEQLVEQRWKLGLRYIKLRHALLRKMGREEEERVASWTSGPAAWALNGDYGRVARHALSTFTKGCTRAGAVDGARVLFVYNPDDPYIDCIDVDDAAQTAREAGLRVSTSRVQCNHVQSNFTSPRLIFRLLNET